MSRMVWRGWWERAPLSREQRAATPTTGSPPALLAHRFGRALRYYSTTADEARTRARKAHESANGFHLSDMGMQPVHRAARRVNGVVQEVAYGLPVEPTCETDIFAALGLEYVPPHMRSFIRRL